MSATRADTSSRSSSSNSDWMVQDEDDFEHGSCMSFCSGPGRVLCKYFVKRKLTDKADVGTKIAEGTLRSEDFDIQQTFRHGLPQQPTCLAFDTTHQLLAIGSAKGSIVILGKVGLEAHLDHSVHVTIRQMLFIEDQGTLVMLCDQGSMYLWDIKHKQPFVTAHLQLGNGSQPTCMSWVSGSVRFMVGTTIGSVYAVDVTTFQTMEDPFLGERMKCVGKVLDVALDPTDWTRLLIAYSEKVVLVSWNAGKKRITRQYSYTDEALPVSPMVMSVCWKGSDHQFAIFYSNGVIQTYTAKPKANTSKPREKLSIHGHVPQQALPSPHGKARYLYLNLSPCLASSENVAKNQLTASTQHSVVLYRKTKGTINPMILSYSDPVIDFLPIPQFPFPQADAKALVVLTEKELIIHDLLADKAPPMSLPFALDIDLSPVTRIELCSNCPSEFIAKLQSFQANIVQFSNFSQLWPLSGGVPGIRPPKSSNDLVITGHLDGSVCFWHCCPASMTFLFTINTFTHFKDLSSNCNGDGTSLAESVPSAPSWSLPEDDNYFAIHLISMDVASESLAIANGGGHIMVFDFLKIPPDFSGSKSESNIQSLTVDFACDSVLLAETKQISLTQPVTSDLKVFNKNSHGVFRMLQHCRCYYWEKQYKHAVVITTLKYYSPMNLLTFGSDCGLAIVCTKTNRIQRILCNPISLFYVADPQSFKKCIGMDISNRFPGLVGKEKGRRRSSSVRVLSEEGTTPGTNLGMVRRRQSVFSLREKLFPLLQPSNSTAVESGSTQDQNDTVTITCLDLVNLQLMTGNQARLTLWVGTHCGHVAVYKVNTTNEIDVHATGIVLKKQWRIVSFYFVDNCGEQVITPYKQTSTVDKVTSMGSQYAVITTQRSIQSIKFPGKVTVGSTDFHKQDIVKSGLFYCQDTPCLLNVTSSGEMLFHSVPSLRHLRTMSYIPFAEPRSLYSFCVSENGQGLHFHSPSQIQCLSLSAQNELNFPYCLPDLIDTDKRASPIVNYEQHSAVSDSGLQLAQPNLQSPSWEASAIGKFISSVHSSSLASLEPQRELDEQQVKRRHSSFASEPFSADSRKGSICIVGDQPLSTHFRIAADISSEPSLISSTESLNLKLSQNDSSEGDQQAHKD